MGVDLRRFGDPVAKQTDWRPLQNYGFSFCTHVLHQSNAYRCVFRPTIGVRLIFLFLIFCGMLMCANATVLYESVADSPGLFEPIGLIAGIVFGGAGIWAYLYIATPRVFDRTIGYFRRGRLDAGGVNPAVTARNALALKDIHALQLILWRSDDPDTPVSSYELNMVLHDATRCNVVRHGNKRQLRADAQSLAAFLKVPLWDATQ